MTDHDAAVALAEVMGAVQITPSSEQRPVGAKMYRLAHGVIEVWEQVAAGTAIATHYVNPADLDALRAAIKTRVVSWGSCTVTEPVP